MSDKINREIFNGINENVRMLEQLFPSCVKDGQVDFDALKQELGEFEEVGAEKYDFTWNGKAKAKAEAVSDILGRTLKIKAGDGVNEDTTGNLYIEGDNLEALKLLRNSYYNKIKMIYIDPPYNTGNDFVYKDNFAMTEAEKQAMAENLGEVDDEGNRLVKNSGDSSKYHTNWLNMMYPRLKIARDLLTDDGVIFVHIDDNEVENLGKLLKEVFNDGNFINLITVKTKIGGVSGSSEGKSLKDTTEFIWAFAKNKSEILFNPIYIKTPLYEYIKKYESEGKSWKYTSVITKIEGKELIKEDTKSGMKFYGYKVLETKSISAFANEKSISIEDAYNLYANKIFRTTNAQSSVRQTVIKETENHLYPMYGCEYQPIKGKNQGDVIEILYKPGADPGQRNMVMMLSDVLQKENDAYCYVEKISSLWDDIDYNNLTKEGDVEFANGKKPIKLLQRLLGLSTSGESLVLDFFAGSSSTAHAVMQLNAEDGGNRKYICVQVPEKTAEDSEAYKAGYKNICEIGKERIRRAGNKIAEGNALLAPNLDVGFKVFKVADTNIKMFSNEIANKELTLDTMIGDSQEAIDFNAGYTDIDVCYELLLRHRGIDLSSKIEKLSIGERTYLIADSILVCLDQKINEKMIEDLASIDPLPRKYIFRDSSFGQDISLKKNALIALSALIEKNTGETKKTYRVEFI